MFSTSGREPFSGAFSSRRDVRPETTGRTLVLMRHGKDAMAAGVKALSSAAGLSTLRASDASNSMKMADLEPSTAMILDEIGVAVVNGNPDQIGRLSIQATRPDSILAVEAERVVYAAVWPPIGAAVMPVAPAAAGAPNVTREYLRGYRDGLDHAADLCFAGGVAPLEPVRANERARMNESAATWGLQATRVVESIWTGSGVKIAVLDTGFDLTHPDFAGRAIVTQSFVSGEPPQDGVGHGTHCIGTAAGARQPNPLPRYGIAYESEIYVGKVLNNAGRGGDADILAGIDWAMRNGCRVVSMSLGAPPGPKPSTVFENIARRALAGGMLIIAAAGNESDRPSYVAPVDHPANCPSIMAVAALDATLQVAFFSNGGIEPNGGQVNIAGPGVDVYSSWPMPKRYDTISGTSMATPHVAGIAALHAQANPGISAVDLWTRLVKSARPLGLPAADVGSGLVQAPV